MLLGVGAGAHPAHHFEAVEVGQPKVHQHGVEIAGVEQRQRLGSGRGDDRLVAGASEQPRGDHGVDLVVLDDQQIERDRGAPAPRYGAIRRGRCAPALGFERHREPEIDCPRRAGFRRRSRRRADRRGGDRSPVPRPLPPNLRLTVTSDWVNGSKIASSLSGATPMPVSLTSKRSMRRPFGPADLARPPASLRRVRRT